MSWPSDYKTRLHAAQLPALSTDDVDLPGPTRRRPTAAPRPRRGSAEFFAGLAGGAAVVLVPVLVRLIAA